MNFPYTKERLHDLHSEHLETERMNYVKDVADYISQQIINKAIATSKKTDGVIYVVSPEQRQSVFHFKHVLGQSRRLLLDSRESYIPQIISLLEQRFPDSVITIDPLRTYVIVNWG